MCKFKFSCLFILFLIFSSSCVYSQITSFKNFDNGRLDSFTLEGNFYRLTPIALLHFGLRGVFEQSPKFKIYYGSDINISNTNRMIYRYSNQTNWTFFDTAFTMNGYYFFYNITPFTYDSVYIAYWYPWTTTQMTGYMNQIHGNQYVHNDYPRGYSLQGRPLYGFIVTDTTVPDAVKKKIVVVSRQHVYESIGSQICMGMSNYLIYSNDSVAYNLRRKAIFWFFPMANIDGVYLTYNVGPGPDFNRSWRQDTLPSGRKEIDTLKRYIFNETNGNDDFTFDIHSNSSRVGDFYWCGVKSGPQPYPQIAANLVRKIRSADSADNGGVPVMEGTIADDVLSMVCDCNDWWSYHSLHAVSFTLEPGSRPPLPLQRIENTGKSICKGLYSVINEMTGISFISGIIPEKYNLYQNYPNPFNPVTKIKFDITTSLSFPNALIGNPFVSLKVYDILGKNVTTLVNEHLQPGTYEVAFDGSNLPGGVFFYRLNAGDFAETKKMLMIK